MARTINKSVLGDDQMMVDYLRDHERIVAGLQKSVDDLKSGSTASANSPIPAVSVDTKSLRTVQQALQSGGIAPINVTGLLGQLSETQYPKVPLLTSHPDPLTVPYDLYVLSGAPNTLWGINRDVNPPVKYQIG